MILICTLSSSGQINVVNKPVSADSNVDSTANYGSSGTTSYVNAQTYDAISQNITETNVGQSGTVTRPIDTSTSNIDGSANLGTTTSFSNQQAKDSSYSLLYENVPSVNDYVIGGTGSGMVAIGGGTTSFTTSKGTISFWMKFNEFDTAAFIWGQNNLFELGIWDTSGNFELDMGVDNAIVTTGGNSLGHWYFFSIVWDDTTNTLLLYRGDGSTAPVIWGSNYAWTSTVVGLSNNGNDFLGSKGGSQIDAQGDDFRYWNIARTQTQLQSDYNIEIPAYTTNLYTYYRFENSLSDEGYNFADGTVSGTLYYSTGKPTNYITKTAQLDLEEAFTGGPYNDAATAQLAIYAGSGSAETLLVDIWNGYSWTNIISSVTTDSWNNVTVTSYLSMNNITIRFRDGDKTENVQSAWQIDAVMLKFTNYNLQWEHQASPVDPSREYYHLQIYASSSDSENFYVQMWDSVNSQWLTAFSTKISSTAQWYNYTISNPNSIGSTITWRYVGDKESQDSVQSTLYIDYAAIYAYDIAPIITTGASDTMYKEGTIGHHLSWIATDDNPGTYQLLRNDTPVDSGSWSDLVVINPSIDGLAKGYYNFTLIVYDTNSNMDVDTAFVTVYDGTAPSIIGTSGNLQYNETTTGHTISWTVTDTNPDTYILYLNGTQNDTNSWSSGSPLVFSVDGLSKGVYNYTIVLTDTSLNEVQNTIIVSVVDQTKPTITSSASDSQYSEGTTGHTISWTANDTYATNYQLWRNGLPLPLKGWTALVPTSDSIDGLAKGTYNFTIVFYDSSGNTRTDTAFITVVDTTNPTINQPSNVAYEEGNTGNSITWSASDLHPGVFSLLINNTEQYSFSWTTGPIVINIDGQGVGFFNFTLVVKDTSNNQNSSSVIVHVTDSVSPVVNSPSDFSIVEDSSGNVVQWVVSDTNPGLYSINRNSTEVQSLTSWSNGIISFPIDGLAKGFYSYTIYLYDSSGNSATDSVIISVLDTKNPVITHPSDTTYSEGTTANTISWTATDIHAGTYVVYIDNILDNTATSWTTSTPIVYNIDGLLKGTHEVTILASDSSGNFVMDNVTVTITDDTSPTITHPLDVNFVEGTTGNNIIWSVSDNYPGTYSVLRNGTEIKTGTWTSSVTFSLDSLSAGDYNITLQVFDTSFNSNSDSVNVTVTDNQNPVVSSPADVNYNEGNTGYSITWSVSDLHPGVYEVYRGASLISSGTWNTSVYINVDGLSAGSYTYTIYVYDSSGNMVQDSVIVTSHDIINPTFTYTPADVAFTTGSTGHSVYWTVTDLHPYNYTIYLDNVSTIVKTGNWVDGGNITLSVDGVTNNIGPHNYTLLVHDTSGNPASDIVNVLVTENPEFTVMPTDIYYVSGATGNLLNWTVIDNNPNNYILYRTNQSQSAQVVDSGTWTSGSHITYNVDGLAIGVYNFTLFANDTDGYYTVDTAYVTVSDVPIITAPLQSDLAYELGSTGNSLTWNASDLIPNFYYVYRNGSQIVGPSAWTNANTVSINIDGLLVGTYIFVITFYDDASSGSSVHNQVSDSVTVTVQDTTPPAFQSSIGDITYNEFSTGNGLYWTFTDLAPNSYTIYRDTSFLAGSGTWLSGNPINLSNIDGLAMGDHTYNITVYDASGNAATNTITVHVVDGTNPIFNSNPADSNYSEGSAGPIYVSWDVSDAHPFGYSITRNGTSVYDSTWTSPSTIQYDVSGLARGTYDFVITLNDTTGNPASDSVRIVVLDTTAPNYNVATSSGNVTYNEGTTGHTATWNYTDLHGSQYRIVRNGTEIVPLTSWTSGTPISISIDGLARGYHNYTVQVYDQSGNVAIHTYIITVNDVTIPNIVTSGDFTVSEGVLNNEITWNLSDTHPFEYTILRNSTDIGANNVPWVNGPVTTSLDGLSKGYYSFTITVYDDSGNFNTSSVVVHVDDTTAPTITPYPDTTIVEGVNGNTIQWAVDDAHSNLYYILKDGNPTPVQSGSWSTSSNISFSLDGLSIGSYTYFLYVNDTTGNSMTDNVTITVKDQTAPNLQSTSGDVSYIEGNPSVMINWTYTDTHPDYYTIIDKNSQLVDSGSWTSGAIINYDVGGTSFGSYTFTITLNDTSGNSIQNTITVIVYDSQLPTITNAPNDQTIDEGTTGHQLSWTLNDTNNYQYKIFQNNLSLPNVTAPYSQDQTVYFSIDGLSKGTYNFTIYVYDLSGNIATDTVIVTVNDVTSPSVSSPADSFYYEGGVRSTVTWTVGDLHASYYEIYNGTTLMVNNTWSTSTTSIQYTFPNMARGDYSFTIYLYDTSGNSASDTVNLQVIDNIAPTLTNNPDSVPADEGSTIKFTWVFSDLHPGMFYLYVNDSAVASGSWPVSPYTYDFSSYSAGYYNITFLLLDDSNNKVVDFIGLTINDVTAPQILSCDNCSDINYSNSTELFYNEFTTGNNITLSLIELHPNYYNLTISNGTSVINSWNSGSVVINIDGLLYGNYKFTMTFFDDSGNSETFIVFLYVYDVTSPSFNSTPNDQTIAEDSTGNTLSWTLTESYPAKYSIKRNGVSIWTDVSWDGSTITIPIDGLAKGPYTFIIYVYDQSGNMATDTVVITVADQTPPALTPQANLTYQSGSTGNTISWTATEKYPSTYIYYLDDAPSSNFVWQSNVAITPINVDGLNLGTHNLTIVFSDTSGNTAQQVINVTVEDTIAPILVSSYQPTIGIPQNTDYQLSWTFTDVNPTTYILTLYDNSTVQGGWSNGSPITRQTGLLGTGQYVYNITVFDVANNSRSIITTVIVNDTIPPTFQTTPTNNLNFTEGETGHVLTWTMNDTYAYNYTIMVNGIDVTSGTWKNNFPVDFNVDSFIKGVYNVTMIIQDGSDNVSVNSTIVNILDKTAPIVTTITEFTSYNEGSTGNAWSWSVTDLYPSSFQIYRNGVLLSNNDWNNESNVIMNIDGLMQGSYNFTILFLDQSQNYATVTITLNVFDVTPPSIVSHPTFHQYLLGNTSNAVYWTVNDLHPANYTLYIQPQGQSQFIEGTHTWQSGIPIQIGLDYAPNYYNISILIFDQSGNSVTDWVRIRIKDPLVTDTIDPNVELTSRVHEGDVETITGVWNSTNDINVPNPVPTDPVPNADIQVFLYENNSNTFVGSFHRTTDFNGRFLLTFNYTNLDIGTYRWEITFSKQGLYFEQTDINYVLVQRHGYKTYLDSGEGLTQGEPYTYSVHVNYSNSAGSLSFNQLTSKSGNVVGIEVITTITYLKSDGTQGTFVTPATTNNNGDALFTLNPDQTLQISKILGFNVAIKDSRFGAGSSTDFGVPDTFVINPPNPNLVQKITNWVQQYSILFVFLLIIILTLFIVFSFYLRQQREKLKQINRSVKIAQEEFNAVMGIKSVIVQTSDKLTVYEELVFESSLNTQLIGGMISAFSSFLNEIGTDRAQGFEMMEREGASITVHKGELSNFIIISESKLPFIMLGQIQRAQKFIESAYKDNFTNTSRGVRKLTKDQIYPKLVEAGLKLSLSEPNTINERNITRVIKLKSISRAIKSNMSQLIKFTKSEDYTEYFLIEDLIKFLKYNRMADSLIARIIMVAYEFDILVPNFNLVEDDI